MVQRHTSSLPRKTFDAPTTNNNKLEDKAW